MRSWDEIEADAVEGDPFASGAEAHAWVTAWCGTCRHDATSDCPLVGLAFMGFIPKEWKPSGPSPVGPWRCTEHERRTP